MKDRFNQVIMNGRRFTILALLAVVMTALFLLIKRSVPYSDNEELFTTEISIDSIWSLGPAAALYDKKQKEYFWLKSYSPESLSALDTLKTKKARIRYMKFLQGPLENRIFWMKVDSVIVFDQVINSSTYKDDFSGKTSGNEK